MFIRIFPVCMHVHHVHICLVPLELELRVVVGMEPRTSTKATSALSCCASLQYLFNSLVLFF